MGIFSERLKFLGTESAFSVGDHIRACEAKGLKVIRLNLGEPDFKSSPEINRVACDNIQSGNSRYVDPQGILPLRESIASHVSEKLNLSVSPDRIVVASGGKPFIGYSMLAYVDPGDEVIFPSPGFPIYSSWVRFMGAVPVPLHLKEGKGFRIAASDLKPLLSRRTKLLILNSPANPTGAVLSNEDLLGIAALVKTQCPSARVLSDEVYDGIIFGGQLHASIASVPGMSESCVILNSFSKTFAMTGWRLGYAVLPDAGEAAVFTQLNINTFSCVPAFIQLAGKAALESRTAADSLVSMTRAFEERRNYFVAALNAIEGIRCHMPQGAFYTFPNITGLCRRLGAYEVARELSRAGGTPVTPSELFQMFLLYRYGVATLDGNSFGGCSEPDQSHLRVSIASRMEELSEGAERLRSAAGDLDGFREFISTRQQICWPN